MPSLTLKFYARTGLFYDPTRPQRQGQMGHYIGREMKMVDGQPTWPAMKKPYEVRLNLAEADHLRASRRIPKHVRNGTLWPADAETAKHCGVPLVDVKHEDGGWVEKRPRATKENE